MAPAATPTTSTDTIAIGEAVVNEILHVTCWDNAMARRRFTGRRTALRTERRGRFVRTENGYGYKPFQIREYEQESI